MKKKGRQAEDKAFWWGCSIRIRLCLTPEDLEQFCNSGNNGPLKLKEDPFEKIQRIRLMNVREDVGNYSIRLAKRQACGRIASMSSAKDLSPFAAINQSGYS